MGFTVSQTGASRSSGRTETRCLATLAGRLFTLIRGKKCIPFHPRAGFIYRFFEKNVETGVPYRTVEGGRQVLSLIQLHDLPVAVP